jgi:hypothetical protein
MCVCVLGWHYQRDFYDRLYEIDVERHVISHRDEAYVAALSWYEMIRDDVEYAPNQGLDWGGYQQFNDRHDTSLYDAVIYCHDDLVIKAAGFVEAVAEALADDSVMVVGNGRNGVDTEFRFAKYRQVLRGEEPDDFLVRTVRGSFFAARPAVLERIGGLPVEWSASAEKMKRGNISLRNFGYLVTKAFGRESITYLEPESWLETRYLIEMRRGVAVAGGER